jgi:hypothetical protein
MEFKKKLALGFCACLCAVGICLAIDETREPSLKYVLTIDGKPHELTLDTPLQIEGKFENPKIVLTAWSTRSFNYGGIAFDYPASCTWEADLDGNKTWTLSGNDYAIMIFVIPAPFSPESYAEGISQQFGKGNVVITDKTCQLGKKSYKGKKITVSVAGQTIIHESYSLSTKNGSRMLVLQDSPPEGKTSSQEGEKALRLLASTFVDTMAADEADTTDNK